MVSRTETEPPPRRSRVSLPWGPASDAASADFDRERRARLFVVVCLSCSLLHLGIVAVHTLVGRLEPQALMARLTFDAALVSAPLVLRWTRSLRVATGLVVGVVSLALPAIALRTGGLSSPMVMTLPLVPIVAAGFLGPRGVVIAGAMLALATVAVAGLEPSRPVADAVLRVVMLHAALCAAVLTAYLHERERDAREATLREHAQRIQRSSVRDALTRLYNQGYVTERLATELSFAVRHQVDLSVILLDVDHFKRVNDRFGHATGDDVLRDIAQRLTQSVRAEDVVGRFGGEEFLVLLRATPVDAAAIVAERIRAAVEASTVVSDGHAVAVTISAGVASLGQTGVKRVRDLLAIADARLYAAKNTGRNRVILAYTDVPEPEVAPARQSVSARH